MQPLHDNYVVDSMQTFKLYGAARRNWTPLEARAWNSQIQRMLDGHGDEAGSLPASGSRDPPECGWEWRWQEDGEAGTKDSFKVGSQWKVASEALAAERERFREWVLLADDRVVSIRCALCTFVHGAPHPPAGAVQDKTVRGYGLPEDIAIELAKRLEFLRAGIDDRRAVLRPADVIAAAQQMPDIAACIANFSKSGRRCDILSVVGGFDAAAELNNAASLAIDRFVEAVLALTREMKSRVEGVLEAGRVNGWTPAPDPDIRAGLPYKSKPRPHEMVINQVRHECKLDHEFTQGR